MLSLREVKKSFDHKEVLHGISASFERGHICGVVGSNGAGKSTLLRCMSGIYKADPGHIRLDDEDIYENPAAKEKLFYLSDEAHFADDVTPRSLAVYYSLFYPDFSQDGFFKLTEEFKLENKKKIRFFSKGQRRQLLFALALSAGTDYLIMDELFDGMDPVVRRYSKKLLFDALVERNCGVIISSHSLREMEDLCDVLCFLHEGSLVYEKNMDELKESGPLSVEEAFISELEARGYHFL